jgi:Ferredoxin-thioredoxin reductase, catalytic subunit
MFRSVVMLYALSTCIHCRHAREYFEKNTIAFECMYVDKLTGKEREAVLGKVREINPSLSFPIMIIGETHAVVVGFNPEAIQNAFAMSRHPETAMELYEALGPVQARKGYYFNHDQSMSLPLLEQLLVTKAMYGYMACPCRLANGDYAADKDIICPCVYREADVAEFGICYCGLYVSRQWNEEKTAFRVVPDRRPPGNIVAGINK